MRVEQAMALGAGAYLHKPYLVANMGQAVRKEQDKPSTLGIGVSI